MKHTVGKADQALHDISFGLREQASLDDDIGILLSCVLFHITGNAMGAVGKIMWSLILIETGLCKQGTANKGFEHK